jgi:hypothetical protein
VIGRVGYKSVRERFPITPIGSSLEVADDPERGKGVTTGGL